MNTGNRIASFLPGITFLFLAFAVVSLSPLAAAQNKMACHSMGMQDELPPDKLPAPLKLTGIGNVHLQIRATPEAQTWFDQGLNLFHDFWDYEAERAFEQGVREDSNCAMCYWGIYQAETFSHSNDKYYATQALDKAMSLRGHASKAEQLYIEAAAAHEAEAKPKDDAAQNKKKTPVKEVDIWRKLVKYHPKDTQARIFLAETLEDGYSDAGEPHDGQKEMLAILQGILKEEPNSSAANHYWIHAVEASPHPEQALHSAEILASLAPTSGHMVHMPGHIFYRTGDYARAEAAFAASMQADEHYMQTQHVQPDDDWNYVHNLMYAIANLMEEGKLEEATDLSAKLSGARGQLDSTLYPWSPRDAISRLDPRLPVALRTADWTQVLDLLKASNPPEALPHLAFLARELTEFAIGMQALEARNVTKADQASGQLDAELWRFSRQVKDAKEAEDSKTKDAKNADAAKKEAPKLQLMPDALPEPLMSNLSIMSLELRAGLLLANKQTEEARKAFAQAAQEEKALGYREPPIYIRPVGETEGVIMMASSDWAGAKAAYQRALLERPKSGFPLYGIAVCSEESGDEKAAVQEYSKFLTAWGNADAALPQLEHARAYLSQHKPAAAALP
jgi:hypothetical protein